MQPLSIHDRHAQAVALAWKKNVSVVDAMAELDMLLTAQRRTEIITGALRTLALILDRETPEGLIRAHYGDSRPTTAAEMFAITRKWIDDYVEMGGVQ